MHVLYTYCQKEGYAQEKLLHALYISRTAKISGCFDKQVCLPQLQHIPLS